MQQVGAGGCSLPQPACLPACLCACLGVGAGEAGALHLTPSLDPWVPLGRWANSPNSCCPAPICLTLPCPDLPCPVLLGPAPPLPAPFAAWHHAGSLLQGPEGSEVVLRVAPARGGPAHDVRLTRTPITINPVDAALCSSSGSTVAGPLGAEGEGGSSWDKLGYIRVATFSKQTAESVSGGLLWCHSVCFGTWKAQRGLGPRGGGLPVWGEAALHVGG